jgi:aspartate ammonia-lyase
MHPHRSRLVVLALSLLAASTPASGREPQTRLERDLLSEKSVPADAYYGVQTARALENFQISGVTLRQHPEFVEALAIVKLAAARANFAVGGLEKGKLDAIERACRAVRDGRYHDEFIVDWYQVGAGTSANMNANEVLANVGLELTGRDRISRAHPTPRRGREPGPHAA